MTIFYTRVIQNNHRSFTTVMNCKYVKVPAQRNMPSGQGWSPYNNAGVKAIPFSFKDFLMSTFQYALFYGSFTQSCLTLCDPMSCSRPGLPVLHHLPESVQTHVCWVDDAIQPSHPLSSRSPPSFNLFQHQGLFKGVSSHIRWPTY